MQYQYDARGNKTGAYEKGKKTDYKYLNTLLTEEVASIISYLNIESRQTTNRSITYDTSNRSRLRWQERVYETGKNLETISSVTLFRNNLGIRSTMEPSKAEVLELLKPAR